MDEAFLSKILACPACDKRPPLTKTADGWKCEVCKRTYPVIDGIPHLIIKEGLTPSPTQQNQESI